MDLPDTVHVLPGTRVAETLLTTLRNDKTPSFAFRAAAGKLSRLLAANALEEEPVEQFSMATPLEEALGTRFHRQQMLVPVLRAGSALTDAFTELLPDPHICDIGLSRDHETLLPREYSCHVPARIPSQVGTCYLLDPMLATGGSAEYAITLLKDRGASRIVFVGVVGAPPGVEKLYERHPDVPVYLACMGKRLNGKGYIEQFALGDFGDRFYNSF